MVPALSDLLTRLSPAGIATAAGVLCLIMLALAIREWRRRRRAELATATTLGQMRTITASMR